MGEGHASCRGRYDIEDGPESFYDLAVDAACAGDEARGISGMAFGLMAMNMPDADARHYGQFRGNSNERIAGQSLAQVLHVLAVDVVEGQHSLYSGHVVGQGVSESVVHVYLPG